MFEIIGSIPVIGTIITFVLPFIIVLSIVVFIHEYGHYIVGRWCGIHAETFSVGFGRVIKSWTDKRGTKWQIAAVPLGGYVKFLGDMNPASTEGTEFTNDIETAERARHFSGAKLYKRALTVVAGPVANFILSFVVFAALVMWQGKPSAEPIIGELHPAVSQNFDLKLNDVVESINGVPLDDFAAISQFIKTENPPQIMPYVVKRAGQSITVDGPYPFLPIVGSVMPVSPASKAGLQENDLILSFDGKAVTSFTQLRDLIFSSTPAEREITVLRSGETKELSIFPRVREFQGNDGSFQKEVSIGVVSGTAFGPTNVSVGIGEALKYGVKSTWLVLEGSVRSISLIISGQISPKNLQGPVGIAHISGDIAKTGIIGLIFLIATISTSIGFLNLLPIPVLDGGHLLMFAYEGITKRKPSATIIHYGTVGAIAMLLTLMVYVTFNDIIRLFLYWA
jgi:regulator of sigma E protease